MFYYEIYFYNLCRVRLDCNIYFLLEKQAFNGLLIYKIYLRELGRKYGRRRTMFSTLLRPATNEKLM